MLTKSRIILVILLLTFSAAAFGRHHGRPARAMAHSPRQNKTIAPRRTSSHRKATRARRYAAKRHLTPRERRILAAKSRRMRRAFVASADLKPMARQLVQNRTPEAFSAVEAYARRHAGSDAGALGWLAAGYAYGLDQHYDQAIAALEKARPQAGDLYDYIQYFEAVCYAGKGDDAKVVELLHEFDVAMPESIFQRDVVSLYGGALARLGRTQDAIDYLEAHRLPTRASVELALGKSYLHSDHPEKGMEILKHLYFTMPLSPESAEAASQLTEAGSALEGSYADEKGRADLLAGAGHWTEAERRRPSRRAFRLPWLPCCGTATRRWRERCWSRLRRRARPMRSGSICWARSRAMARTRAPWPQTLSR
jgi:soluble lytic murein transglycosylase